MRANSLGPRNIIDKTRLSFSASVPTPILVAWSVALLLVAASSAHAQIVLRVDAHATGANNGGCWEDAYIDLQDALDRAAASGGSVTEVWVAAGTYRPTKHVELRASSAYQKKSIRAGRSPRLRVAHPIKPTGRPTQHSSTQ